MKVQDFINTCVDEDCLWSQGEHEGRSGYYVKDPKYSTVTHFPESVIESHDWPTLRRQIVQGHDVHHVTRIVGYYSRIENWNKSKLGELKDRHQGDYRVG